MRKLRVVIAGQIPPPYGGQNIMIRKAVAQFSARPDCETIHLPFFFTSDLQTARSVSVGKVIELLRVIGRLLRIRSAGPIDLFLYPTGGPQTVPIIRDIVLLPLVLLCSHRVVLHFHAAGVAERFEKEHGGSLLSRLLSSSYRRAAVAVVMTEFNRRDPVFFGIDNILVRPHRIPDEYDEALLSLRGRSNRKRLLYVGHLHPAKGTEALLRAFAALRRVRSDVTLELVGECLPPWNQQHVETLVNDCGLTDDVTLSGTLTGKAKQEAFARADLFVFPSVAPYESFGLVLVEAMMWKLPIVCSEWRGNLQVLTPEHAGVTFPVTAPMESALERALVEALAHEAEWPEWGRINRSIFETHYREESGNLWLADAILAKIDKQKRKGP